ncbi:hypothetical protein E4T39_03545 [Aureobasidium subglaciale]|nr:hypothetical protein E4T39_03545 [Aureobasidium subglaciale]
MTKSTKSEESQNENHQEKSHMWIEVEDLEAYYSDPANDPPGRKYPAPTDAEFEDSHIDTSSRIIRDDGRTASQIKEAAKLSGRPSGKSAVKSRAQADAKAALTTKPSVMKTKKTAYEGKGKGKKAESSDDEEEEEEKDREEKLQAKELKPKMHKNCDTCRHGHIKCELSSERNDDGELICKKCVKQGIKCHFSALGTIT